MKKIIRKISILFFVLVLFGCASKSKVETSDSKTKEPVKSIEEWQTEIEDITGPITWMYKESLQYAQNFKGEVFYKFDNYDTIKIMDPMMITDSPKYITSRGNRDYLYGLKCDYFHALKEGDIFLTHEGYDKGIVYFWLLEYKKVFDSNGKNSGFIKETNSYIGEPFEKNKIIYNSLSKPDSGEFKMKLNYTTQKSIIEFSMKLLGVSNQENAFETAKKNTDFSGNGGK